MAVQYTLRYADAAVSKTLLRLPSGIFERINSMMQELRLEPRGLKTKKLHGLHPPLYELRIHPYRVIYDIDDAKRVIVILGVIHRKDLDKFLRRIS